MKALKGAVVGLVVLGLVLPMACHLPETLELFRTLPIQESIVALVENFGSTRGALAGVIIGLSATARS